MAKLTKSVCESYASTVLSYLPLETINLGPKNGQKQQTSGLKKSLLM